MARYEFTTVTFLTKNLLRTTRLFRRRSSCLTFIPAFSCHVRPLPRQSTRYFSKKISVARVTNRITTRKSRQQRKRVGRFGEVEQIAAESADEHDGDRFGERHRGDLRTQGVDPANRRGSHWPSLPSFPTLRSERRLRATDSPVRRLRNDFSLFFNVQTPVFWFSVVLSFPLFLAKLLVYVYSLPW